MRRLVGCDATEPRMISISDRKKGREARGRMDGLTSFGVQIMQLHRAEPRNRPPPSFFSKAPLKMFSAMTLSFLPSFHLSFYLIHPSLPS